MAIGKDINGPQATKIQGRGAEDWWHRGVGQMNLFFGPFIRRGAAKKNRGIVLTVLKGLGRGPCPL